MNGLVQAGNMPAGVGEVRKGSFAESYRAPLNLDVSGSVRVCGQAVPLLLGSAALRDVRQLAARYHLHNGASA